nr:hypothetical protein [Tanacetum cinerariifolium]
MVNTRTDAELSAAVQNALQTLLFQICAEIHEEFRTSYGPSNSGYNGLLYEEGRYKDSNGLVVLDDFCEEIFEDLSGIEKDYDCVMVVNKFVNEAGESLSFDKEFVVGLGSKIVVELNETLNFSPTGKYHDLRYFEGWVGENKNFNVFAYDLDEHSSFTEGLTGEEEMNMKERYNKYLNNVTTPSTCMVGKIRNWVLILRTTSICELEMIKLGMEDQRKLSDVDTTNNEGSLGHLKFDILKWSKRKKPCYTNVNLRVAGGSLTYENGLIGKRNSLMIDKLCTS